VAVRRVWPDNDGKLLLAQRHTDQVWICGETIQDQTEIALSLFHRPHNRGFVTGLQGKGDSGIPLAKGLEHRRQIESRQGFNRPNGHGSGLLFRELRFRLCLQSQNLPGV
jgi:hypothetical protein